MRLHISPLTIPLAVVATGSPVMAAGATYLVATDFTGVALVITAMGTAIVGVIGAISLMQQSKIKAAVADVKTVADTTEKNTNSANKALQTKVDRLEALLGAGHPAALADEAAHRHELGAAADETAAILNAQPEATP